MLALNTNAANLDNFYLPGFKNDPSNHIAWLEAELAEIEANGGIAYIIGHYYQEDFSKEFGLRYHALMERYQHIVRNSLNGHTHDQFYQVTMSMTHPDKSIGTVQIGPSVTTYTDENPGYAILDVDAKTMLPINYRIFAMDLAEANSSGTPVWKEVVNYTEDYGLGTGVSPASLLDLSLRFAQDQDLYWQYEWDMTRQKGKKHVGTVAQWEHGSERLYCRYTSVTKYAESVCNNGKEKAKNSIKDELIGKWKKLANEDSFLQ